MKFSELSREEWFNLQPYLDTCLIPVSGMAGGEAPWEMAELAAAAGAWLLPLEKAFAGRTVTLPAYHYYDGSDKAAEGLKKLVAGCREAGFRHVVLVCGVPSLLPEDTGADLIFQPGNDGDKPDAEALQLELTELWRNARPASAKEQP